MKYFILVLSLFVGTSAMAQGQAAPEKRKPTKERPALPKGAEPGRTMKPSRGAGKLAASYADSNEFNKAFIELYSIIKPKVTVQERAQSIFLQNARTFARTGVDSVKAHEAVMKAVNPKLDYELIYATYRAQLTAEELSAWVSFIKTPAGRKIMEVGDKLLAADDKLIESQVRRTVNTAIAPLRQAKPRQMMDEGTNGDPSPRGPSATATSGVGTSVVDETPAKEKK
jgi:hypothetical protein